MNTPVVCYHKDSKLRGNLILAGSYSVILDTGYLVVTFGE